jgi:hypothetical protein
MLVLWNRFINQHLAHLVFFKILYLKKDELNFKLVVKPLKIMTKIYFNKQIYFFVISLMIFITSCGGNSKNQEEKKANVCIDCFELKDDTIKINHLRDISNLEKKNGFKNIQLGSLFSIYKFNTEEYQVLDYYGGVIKTACKNFKEEQIAINNVGIRRLELVFYKDKLMLIALISDSSDKNSYSWVEFLREIYGEAESDLDEPINRNEDQMFSYLFKSISYVKQKKYQGAEGLKHLNELIERKKFEPVVLNYDSDLKQYYSESNYQYSRGWKSKSVSLIHTHYSKTKYYRKKESISNNLPGMSDYSVETSFEKIVIYKSKPALEALIWIKNYLNKLEIEDNDSLQKENDNYYLNESSKI